MPDETPVEVRLLLAGDEAVLDRAAPAFSTTPTQATQQSRLPPEAEVLPTSYSIVWVPRELVRRARWILSWPAPTEAELTFLAVGSWDSLPESGSHR